jgi:hypothetical protein
LLQAARQLAPSSSAVTVTADEGGPGALLPPLITQFALMQQQMCDQFQQALLSMAQMFGDLHRDQLQLIQQEMAQLHELTRELQGLQTELTRQTPAQAETKRADKFRTVSSLRPSAPAFPADRRGKGPAPAMSAPVSSARPKASTSPTLGKPGGSGAPPSQVPLQSDTEVHAWLTQRLAVLQEERQTRWQKILQVVTGG